MAKKVSQDDIIQMNELYARLKTYAAVARETGFSASTVSKYVDKNYVPAEQRKIRKFTGNLPEFSLEIFQNCKKFGDLCILSDKEVEEVKELWEELAI